MKKSTILAVALAFVSAWVVLATGIKAIRLTDVLRVFGLVMLPAATVGSLLVLYLDWRAKLRRRILAERGGHDLEKAA